MAPCLWCCSPVSPPPPRAAQRLYAALPRCRCWQEHKQQQEQQVPEEHQKELCGGLLLSPCLPLSHARLWHEPGSPLEAEIPGARIQAAVQLRCGKKKKAAKQESCLGSALKFWSPYCSSNTSACQKATSSWPGACILLSNPHLFPSPFYLTTRNSFVLTQDRLLLSMSPDSAPVGSA